MNTSGGFALMKSFCFVCAYWSSCFLLYQFLNLPKSLFGWKWFSFWILISSNYTFALLLLDLGTCSGRVRDSFSLWISSGVSKFSRAQTRRVLHFLWCFVYMIYGSTLSIYITCVVFCVRSVSTGQLTSNL